MAKNSYFRRAAIGVSVFLHPNEAGFLNLFVWQSLEILEDFRKFMPQNEPDHIFLERLGKSAPFRFVEDMSTLSFEGPALIITGRQDFWVGYHEAFSLVKNFPRATYAVLDGAGHAVAYEQKTIHRVLFRNWLDRVEQYARH